MKKFLAIALMAIMLVTMALPAFAGASEEADRGNIKFEIQKANVAQVLDGKITEGEYYEVAVKDTWISTATADDANLDAALKMPFKLYMSWDDANVYFAITVTPAKFDQVNDDNVGNMWNSNCVQFGYAKADASGGGEHYEGGIALSSVTGNCLSTMWSDPTASGYVAAAGKDFTVVNNGGTLTYECATPWSVIADAKPAEGYTFGACYVMSTGVDADYIHTQVASGVTAGKESANFAKVTLAAAPIPAVVEVEEEVPPVVDAGAAAPATDAAQTSDSTWAIALVAVAALGMAVVVTKKVRN